MNPLAIHFFMKDRNLTSVFSDGDGRVLVGESILTSAMNSYAQLFKQTIGMLLNRTWTRFDYSGGFDDGSAFLTFYGGAFWDNPTIRQRAEPILEREYARLVSRQSNGFCGVSALGLPTGTRKTNPSTPPTYSYPNITVQIHRKWNRLFAKLCG